MDRNCRARRKKKKVSYLIIVLQPWCAFLWICWVMTVKLYSSTYFLMHWHFTHKKIDLDSLRYCTISIFMRSVKWTIINYSLCKFASYFFCATGLFGRATFDYDNTHTSDQVKAIEWCSSKTRFFILLSHDTNKSCMRIFYPALHLHTLAIYALVN